jgi:hypothetical protein
MGKRIYFFAVYCVYMVFTQAAAAQNGQDEWRALTAAYLEGEWHGSSVLGVMPLLRYSADGNFFSGLFDMFGKEHAVCIGTYTISGNAATETPLFVENSFYGKISRIKAGKTIMRVTLYQDDSLLSTDAPFGGRVMFKKAVKTR